MTQVTVPAAGDAVDASWGQAVANHANHLIPVYMTADVSKTGNSFSNITGLTFDVVNGKSYAFDLVLWYDVGGTSTGLAIAVNHPGGHVRMRSVIGGNASATGTTSEWILSTDTATGTTTTDAVARRDIRLTGNYTCTGDGTFAFRYQRQGTSTTVTIYAGSGGLVVEN